VSADAGHGATVARRFLVLGFGEAVARLVGFAAMVVAARALGAPMYGIIGVATAVTLYLNRIVDWGLDLGLGVREVAARPGDLPRLLPSLLVARLGVAVVIVALVALVSVGFLPEPDSSTILVSSLTLLAVGLGARRALLGLGQHRLAALATLAGQLLTAILLVILVHGPGDVARVPQAQLAGELLLAGLVLWALTRGQAMGARLDPAVVRPLVPRGGALAVSALLGLLIYNVSFLFLRAMQGPAAVGYFNAAATLITFFLNLGTAYSMSLLPSLAALVGDREKQVGLFQTAALQVTALALPIALGGTLLALPLVAMLYGSGYLPAAIPLAILIWSIPLCVVRDLPLMVLQASGREGTVLRVTAWAAGLNLGLNALLIPRYGIAGAAAAGVATEAVRLGIAYSAVRAEGFRLPGVLRFWKVGVASMLLAGAVALTPGPTPLRVLAGGAAYLAGLRVTGAIRRGSGWLPRLSL
jgi:O-antigen/teichoic acid export membrane protein